MEMGRGGAYVPARVALQGRIHRSIPRTQCVYFWYGNAAARTFGRAHRHRPYHSNTCRHSAEMKTKNFNARSNAANDEMQKYYFRAARRR